MGSIYVGVASTLTNCYCTLHYILTYHRDVTLLPDRANHRVAIGAMRSTVQPSTVRCNTAKGLSTSAVVLVLIKNDKNS